MKKRGRKEKKKEEHRWRGGNATREKNNFSQLSCQKNKYDVWDSGRRAATTSERKKNER